MRSKLRYLALLTIVVTAMLFHVAMAAPQSAAGVLTSRGQLLVKRKGTTKFVPLPAKGQLYVGDIVGTGANGKAKLLLSDGSQFGLNANSAVEITAPTNAGKGRQSFVRALSGQIWARLRPGNAVQTPSATLGVSGTLINLSIAEDGATTLTVVDGEVDFYNRFGETTVTTSQQSTARLDAAPTTPITIPNAGLIVEWTLDLDQAVIPREKFFGEAGFRSRQTLDAEVARLAAQAAAQPNNAEAQLRFGDALFDAGKFQEAHDAWPRRAEVTSSLMARVGYADLELKDFDEARDAFTAALMIEPNSVLALTGLAQLQLALNRPQQAQDAAQRAVAADAKSAEANIALGLALMRQPTKQSEAKAAFDAALQGEPTVYRYQAHAWLALLALAQSDQATALREGQAATRLAPLSALAHGNLALAYFYSGKARESEREARLATQLNPNSPAARVALGQALLAGGDVDGAARMAAQAVALDPQLAPAHYLLGIAAAGRRDYRHAVRDLGESLRLTPDFLPAAAALARVYTRMGRKTEAVAVLTEVQARQPNNKDVLTALGEVYYQQADYSQAIATFQKAVEQAPSALAYAGLAKVAMDANRLDLAITAGQKAVQLAPQIAQYHAILGQIYSFSRLEAQSQRELRTALALDPQNAFALAQFSLKLVEGDARLTARTRGVGFRQAFLLDPAISDQLLRGGIDSEIRASGGAKSWDGALLHRDRAADGKLHFLGQAQRGKDEGNRANDDESVLDAYQELTYSLNPATNIYLNLIHNEVKAGLPGFETKPVLDDRDKFRLNQGIIGARRRIGRQAHLWAGILGVAQRDERTNPGRDSSFRATPVDNTINVPQSLQRAKATSSEVRLDFPSNIQAASPGLFSLGVAHLRTRQNTTRLFSSSFGPREDLGILEQPAAVDTNLVYLQLAQRLGQRLSLTGQLRYQSQKVSIDSIFTSLSPNLPIFTIDPERSKESGFLPSLVANYQLNPKTQLRLITAKRSTDVVSSIFAPVDSATSSEEQTLLLGVPRNLRTIELDAERYLASGSFLKAFLFRSTADSLGYGLGTFSNPSSSNNALSNLLMSNVKRSGAGVRFEQKLTRNLFGQVLFAVNKTTGTIAGVAGSDQRLPYHPKYQAGFGLNYVDSSGTKASLQINRSGSFFQDTGTGIVGPRIPFPAKTYVDLTLAKEPSVRTEVFLKVSNLFNTRQIVFNDVPIGDRRIVAGFNARF